MSNHARFHACRQHNVSPSSGRIFLCSPQEENSATSTDHQFETGARITASQPNLLTNMIRRLLMLAAVLSLGTAVAQAAAVGMPNGARSFIEVSSNDMTDEIGAIDNLGLTNELFNVPGYYPGSIRAAGSTGANYLRGYLKATGNTSAFLWVSKVDTFTLHSDTLAVGTAVNLSVALEVDGTTIRPIGPITSESSTYGYGGAFARIGNWNSSSATNFSENLRVSGGPQNGASYGVGRTSLNVAEEFVTRMYFTGYIGHAFDLGFSLHLGGYNMILDYANTAWITFDLPGEVRLTSLDGWGASSAPSVPDSGATLALVAMAAGLLGLVRRIKVSGSRPAA